MSADTQMAPNQIRSPLSNRSRMLLSVVLVLIIAWHWGSALGIEFKARLAQVLIEQAWQQQLQASAHKAQPWPWADTHPVARLQWLDDAHKVKQDLYVLAGADGSSLAFGPGQVSGLGETKAKVVAGHRDTHFAFLKHLRAGDQLRWQDRDGVWRSFKVSRLRIADSDQEELWVDTDAETLWLVTCYPFDALQAGGPLRYLVQAQAEGEPVGFPPDAGNQPSFHL